MDGFFPISDPAARQGKQIKETNEMFLMFLAITLVSDYNKMGK